MANPNRPKYEPDYGEAAPIRRINPLRIPEILLQVLELLSPREKAIGARVCRFWSEPALGALWRNLTDLAPFLKLFPLLKEIRNTRMSPAEKLERIQSYAARVRTLQVNTAPCFMRENKTVGIFRALVVGKLNQYLPAFSVPTSGIFPNLHTLQWADHDSYTRAELALRTVSCFLNPSLKHLTLSGRFGIQRQLEDGSLSIKSEHYGPLFRTLTAMDGLKLESLDFRVGESTDTLAEEFVPCLRQHSDTLVHLYAWARLIEQFQTEIWSLSKLRSLELGADHFAQAAHFIEGLADAIPEIEALDLSIAGGNVPDEVQRLWDALKRFRKLRRLDLKIPEPEELQDGEVRSMAEAWPLLSRLFIMRKRTRGAGHGSRSPPPSMRSLGVISRHFSQSLTTLGFYFVPDILPTRTPSPVRFERLQLLYVQSPFRPHHQKPLVKFLSQILPHEAAFEGDLCYGWEDVVSRLKHERAKAKYHLNSLQQ